LIQFHEENDIINRGRRRHERDTGA